MDREICPPYLFEDALPNNWTPGQLCTDACEKGRHHHVCQLEGCEEIFFSARSDAKFCKPSHASLAARARLPQRRCGYVDSRTSQQCANNAMPGLRDGYCQSHHRQRLSGKGMHALKEEARGKQCSWIYPDGTRCRKDRYAKGYCGMHYERDREGRDMNANPPGARRVDVEQCEVVENGTRCERLMRARGMCGMHYSRLTTTGSVGPVGSLRRQPGEGHLNKNGYIEIQIDGVKWLQHVWVMSEHLGERVDSTLHEVHHKNLIRHDNRIENLELKPIGHGAGAHLEDLVPFLVDHHYDLIEMYRRDGNCDAFPSWARKS